MHLQLYKFTKHLHSGKTAAHTLDNMHIIFTWIVHMSKYNFLVVFLSPVWCFKSIKPKNHFSTLFITLILYNRIPCAALNIWVRVWPIIICLIICFFCLLYLYTTSLPSLKINPSTFVYYLVFVKCSFILTLRHSGRAKTWPIFHLLWLW